jgi:hypothetical protein
MKYVLVANNKKLTEGIVDQLKLEKDDIVILFNYMWPFFNFDVLKNHPNKIFIGRQRPIKPETVRLPFAGIDLVKEHEDKFQKIIFHSHPKFLSDKNEYKKRFQDGIDLYNFDPKKIDYLEPHSSQTRKRIGYPKGKNMSTGIIVYDYCHQIKNKQDDILLLGFTSELARSFHNDSWEVNYFTQQIKNHKCQAIGCADLEQQKYQHIYNKLKWGSYLRGNHGDKAKDILLLLQPKSILDIGCGPNLFCKNTVKDLCPCTGLDFAGKYKDIYGDVCIGLNDINDKQFDLVTCFDVFEHLLPSCIETALIEMKRISSRFLFQIDYGKPSKLSVFGSPLHQTIKSKPWWHKRIKEHTEQFDGSGKYIYGKWKD